MQEYYDLHPRIEELLLHLERTHATLQGAVAEIPAELRAQRPSPEKWSAAEVLEHLAIVEGSITSLFTRLLASAREEGLGGETETSSVLPTFSMEKIVDRSYRVTSNERSLPSGAVDADAALALLVERRAAMREALRGANGLALERVSAPHPVFGPLNLYQWMIFLGGHEARHAEQLREIAATLKETAE